MIRKIISTLLLAACISFYLHAERDLRKREVKSFEFTDPELFSIVKNYILATRACDDNHGNGQKVFVYQVYLPNTIYVSIQTDSHDYDSYDDLAVCFIDSIPVVIDPREPELSKRIKVDCSKTVIVSNFVIGIPMGIRTPSTSMELTYDNQMKLIKSELYYNCEQCPPVDRTLFPEGTEFHLWRCDEE